MSSHDLRIEIGRHNNMIIEDRLCVLCGKYFNRSIVECEFHFLLECESFSNLRNIHLKDVSCQQTIFNFVKLMKSDDEKLICDISKFIYCAFSYRDALLV